MRKGKYYYGARLAKQGANHLAYVNTLQDKEFDIPDDTAEKDIDAALMNAVFEDLGKHIKDCRGCSSGVIDEVRSKLGV